MQEISLKAMTWNVYLGGEIAKIIDTPPSIFPARVSELWRVVQLTDFRARADAMAQVIAREYPDVLALQEVFRWSTVSQQGMAIPQEVVEYDFLALLLAALEELGAAYFCAVQSPGVNLVLPLEQGGSVRLEDSVAILLKAGSSIEGLSWTNPRSARFNRNHRVKLNGEPFDIARGWASLDLCIGTGPASHKLRVVTTHMEYFSPEVQPEQVKELLKTPCATTGPRLLMGDFNSPPHSDAWNEFQRYGYTDAWQAKGLGAGYTSGQDEDLGNAASGLTERLDWILCRAGIEVVSARPGGRLQTDKTPSGQWPSDHAAVVTELKVLMQSRLVYEPAEEQDNDAVAVIRKLYDRFERRDAVGVMACFAPEAYLRFPGDPAILPWAGEFRGAGLMRFLAGVGCLNYLEFKCRLAYGSGGRVTAICHERCEIKATGEIFDQELVAVARVENGLIVDYVEFADTAKMHAAFTEERTRAKAKDALIRS